METKKRMQNLFQTGNAFRSGLWFPSSPEAAGAGSFIAAGKELAQNASGGCEGHSAEDSGGTELLLGGEKTDCQENDT